MKIWRERRSVLCVRLSEWGAWSYETTTPRSWRQDSEDPLEWQVKQTTQRLSDTLLVQKELQGTSCEVRGYVLYRLTLSQNFVALAMLECPHVREIRSERTDLLFCLTLYSKYCIKVFPQMSKSFWLKFIDIQLKWKEKLVWFISCWQAARRIVN